MAIVLDAKTCPGRAFNNSRTVAHTCSGKNRILTVIVNCHSGVGVTLAQYAGVNMTQAFNRVGTALRVLGYYLLAPATGVNNLVINFSGNTANWLSIQSYVGVEQAIGVRAAASTSGNSTINTATCVSQVGDHVVYGGQNSFGTNGVAVAPLLQQCRTGGGGGFNNYYAADQPGLAGNTTSSYVIPTSEWVGCGAYALIPSVGLRGRAVKYYYDLWDPKPSVKDIQGKVVPPDQLRSDAWIEMQGAVLPQSEIYDSFVEDPSKARVVEVSAKTDDATLKASRSQFAEVLIKRAAGGRG